MGDDQDKQIIANDMAQTLNVADESAAHDAIAKKLVANKAILAYILKYSMAEFADTPLNEIPKYIEGKPKISKIAVMQDHADIEDTDGNEDVEVELLEADEEENGKLSGSRRIEGSSTEDKSIREGSIYYDIRFVARVPKDGTLVEIIINVEIQKNDTPGYPITKRGIYYGSRMISAQKGTVFTGQHYEKIQKVVSVWICVGTAEDRADSINEYQFQETCRHGEYKEKPENYDLGKIVVIRLGAKGEKSDNLMVRLLSKLFSQTISKEAKIEMLPNEFNIAVTETISQEVDTMCNLSAGIYDNGMQKGIQKGRLETLRDNVKNVMESFKVTLDDAMTVLKVSEEDQAILRKML